MVRKFVRSEGTKRVVLQRSEAMYISTGYQTRIVDYLLPKERRQKNSSYEVRVPLECSARVCNTRVAIKDNCCKFKRMYIDVKYVMRVVYVAYAVSVILLKRLIIYTLYGRCTRFLACS